MAKRLIYLVLIVVASLAGSVQGKELEVDQNAPNNRQPTLEEGPNKIPIVNITAPSPAGVSHNIFKEYNVDQRGIVFNNNNDLDPGAGSNLTVSYLAKQPLFINENLHSRAAGIILTEVSGTNPSSLLGYTEIYGKTADFILANPNGIYVNGAGFINVHRITLTTGTPQLDFQGALKALMVDRGTIEIKGKGLVVSLPDLSASPIDILSRAVKISAVLWAQDQANIYTGVNQWDYTNKTLTPRVANASEKPYLAIDGALVADISARKITIIATEKGVGVNCPALVADADNIEITAAGTIRLRNLQTARDLVIESQEGDVVQEAEKNIVKGISKIRAPAGDISFATQELYLSGDSELISQNLTLRPSTHFRTSSSATLHLQVKETLLNQGQIEASKLKLLEPLQNFTNEGSICLREDLTLNSQTVHNTGKLVAKQGDIELAVSQGIRNENLIASAKKLTLVTGDLYNKGKLNAGQDLMLKTKQLHNQGAIASQGSTTIQATETIDNTKQIYSAQKLSIQAGPLRNSGKIKAVSDLDLNAEGIENTHWIISKEGQLTLKAQDDIDNKKLIQSGKKLQIETQKKFTNHDSLIAQDLLQARGYSIVNYGTMGSQQSRTILTGQGLICNEGAIAGAGEVHINTPETVANNGQILASEALKVQGKILTNTGEILSKTGGIQLKGHEKLHNESCILSIDKLQLHTKELNNKGTIQSHQTIQAEAHNIQNSGEIKSRGQVSLKAHRRLYNEKIIISEEGLDIVTNSIINQDQIDTAGSLQLTTQHLQNQGQIRANALGVDSASPFELKNEGKIHVKTGLSLPTQSLHNTGEMVVQEGNLSLQAQGKVYNKGVIISGKNLSIATQQDLENQGTLGSISKLSIDASTLTNTGAIATQMDDIQLTARQAIHNQGQATIISAKDLTVQANEQPLINSGVLYTAQHFSLVAPSLVNAGSIETVNGIATLRLSTHLHNQGIITNEGNLALTTDCLSNIGQLATKEELKIVTKTLDNQGMLEGNKTSIVASASLHNKKEIQGVQFLQVDAGQLANQGILGAQDRLVVATTQDLENNGEIGSHQGIVSLNLGGNLCNNQIITSGKDLQIRTSRVIKNTAQLSSQAQLQLEASSITNQGTIVSGTGSKFTIHGDMVNEATISSGDQLQLEAEGSLKNGKDTHLAAAGELSLRANNLDNYGTIAGGEQTTLTTTRDINNYTIIQGTQQVKLVAQNKIDNLGEVVAGTALHLQAKHLTNQGTLRGGTGNITLLATTNFENHHPVVSAQDLYIDTPLLQNNSRLVALKSLRIKATNLTNEGDIIGGKGNNAIRTSSGRINNNKFIGSVKDLVVEADTLENKGQLTANQSLQVTTQSFVNNGKFVGGKGTTTLTVMRDFNNQTTVESVKDLHISMNTVDVTNQGKLAAMGNLRLQAKSLYNYGQITGGNGVTTLATSGVFSNSGTITSTQDLQLQLGSSLSNYHQIIAGKLLTIQAYSLYNGSGAQIEGGEDTALIEIRKDLTNTGTLSGQQKLTLEVSYSVTNTGKIQAAQGLIINAYDLTNRRTIFSGGNLITKIGRNLHNEGDGQGVIWSQKDMNLQGYDITNYLGKIEAKGDMSIKTNYLRNKGRTEGNYRIKESYQGVYGTHAEEDWIEIESTRGKSIDRYYYRYTYDKHGYHGWLGTKFYERKKEAISEMRTTPAHISASGNLWIEVSQHLHNYGSVIAAGGPLNIWGSQNVNNETPSLESVFISDAHIYEKTWVHREWQYSNCIRKYRKSETFQIQSINKPIIQGYQSLYIQGRSLENGTSLTDVKVAHQDSPVEKLAATQTISVVPHITLPTSQYGLFKLNVNGSGNIRSAPSLEVAVTLPTLPTYADLPGLPHYELPPVSTDQDPETAFEYIPTDATAENGSIQVQRPPPPPHTYLIEANVPVDLEQFYGSPYFIKKLRIDTDQPLRFLGDPFYESQLINDSILKTTTKKYLNEAIATEEEQIKYLINNAAEVSQDLKLSLGVALSKEQINNLNKDILWYVEQSVHGQTVLTPQVYLSKATIQELKSPTGKGLYTRGQMKLDLTQDLTNTGHVAARGSINIKAGKIHNETTGPAQATIQSTSGGIELQADNDIKNLSGKISGQKGLRIVSQHGSIVNETKVNVSGTQLQQKASLESGADLFIKAKKDVINQAAGIKAKGNASIKAEEGNVQFLTQGAP